VAGILGTLVSAVAGILGALMSAVAGAFEVLQPLQQRRDIERW
jgi:hypothetical protein